MPERIGLDVLRPPHCFFVWALGGFVIWCFTKYSDMSAQNMRLANEPCQTANMPALPISDGMKKRLTKNSKGRLILHNYAMVIPENHK